MDFINKINEDKDLQTKLSEIKKKDWAAFSALAKEAGFNVEITSGNFSQACLSSQVGHFCKELSDFAGYLHNWKM